MKIILIRHAMTNGNLHKRYIGKTDEDILSVPCVASKEAGIVYVTPLKRTSQTAAGLFPRKKQVVVSALAEMDFGLFEGKNYHEMKDFLPYRNWVDGGCIATCPGGESFEGFSKRVCNGFLQLVNTQKQKEIFFVVHGGVIMALMQYFCPEKDFYSWHCENCCGYIFEWENGQAQNIKSVRYGLS